MSKLSQIVRSALLRYNHAVYGASASTAVRLPGADDLLEPAPIPADWVREGEPCASSRFLTRSPDGGLATGIWECTPGRFRWFFGVDEVVVILFGSGIARVGDVVHELKPGVTVYFPVGTESEWTIHQKLRKHFIHRDPSPIVSKLIA
ncbi:MAG: hypothetical protein RL385_3426 [Pseudomonadota bacterium]|jgi:uncharacterized cupin superfamily protein